MPTDSTRLWPDRQIFTQLIGGLGLAVVIGLGGAAQLATGFGAVSGAVAAERVSEGTQISPQDLKKQLQKAPTDILLIDVRTLEEFQSGHLTGAVHVPLAHILHGEGVAQVHNQLADRQLVLYCRSGKRSQMALEKLRSAGLSGQSLSGGLIEWRQQVDPALPSP
jgi:rhodanese-related sulfurtransferase